MRWLTCAGHARLRLLVGRRVCLPVDCARVQPRSSAPGMLTCAGSTRVPATLACAGRARPLELARSSAGYWRRACSSAPLRALAGAAVLDYQRRCVCPLEQPPRSSAGVARSPEPLRALAYKCCSCLSPVVSLVEDRDHRRRESSDGWKRQGRTDIFSSIKWLSFIA
jgi:hypothetical protein